MACQAGDLRGPSRQEVLPFCSTLPGSELCLCPWSWLGATVGSGSPASFWAEAGAHLSAPASSSPHPLPSLLPLLSLYEERLPPSLASFPFLTRQGCSPRSRCLLQCLYVSVHICMCAFRVCASARVSLALRSAWLRLPSPVTPPRAEPWWAWHLTGSCPPLPCSGWEGCPSAPGLQTEVAVGGGRRHRVQVASHR